MVKAPAVRVPTWWRPTVVMPAAVWSAFFVMGVAFLFRTWHPIGDFAIAELVVRHTSRVIPLSGPYSAGRGFNHPLPLVYAIQWLPYRIFGERSSAGLATSIWWNGAWLGFLAWFTARLRAEWLAVGVIAAVALLAARTPAMSLALPWNPSLAVIPATVLVFVAWRMALGCRWCLPLASALTVWCVGAHLGFAAMAVPLVVVAVAGLIAVTLRRAGTAGLVALWKPALAAAGVALVMTAPMIVDVVRHGRDSNPAHIIDNGRADPSKGTESTSQAVKVLRAELAMPPAWARVDPPFDYLVVSPPARFPWMLLLGAAAAVGAWQRRARDELLGMGLALIALLGATAGITTIEAGTLVPWFLLPAHAAGMALYALVAWSGARSVGGLLSARRTERLPAVLRSVAVPAVVSLALIASIPSHLEVDVLHPPIDGRVTQLADAGRDALPHGTTVLLRGPINSDGFYTAALALALDRNGLDVRVPDDQLYMFSDTMRLPPGTPHETLDFLLSKGPPERPSPTARLLAIETIEPFMFTDVDQASLWLVER